MTFQNVPQDSAAAVIACVEHNPVIRWLEVEWDTLPFENSRSIDDLVTMVAQSTHLQPRLERLMIGCKAGRSYIATIRLSTMKMLSACCRLTHLRLSWLGTTDDDNRYIPLAEMVSHLPPTLCHFSERADRRDHLSALGVPTDNHCALIDAFTKRLEATLTELRLTHALNGAALRILATSLPRLVILCVGTVCDFDAGEVDQANTNVRKHDVCAPLKSPWFPTLKSLTTGRCAHESAPTVRTGLPPSPTSRRRFAQSVVTRLVEEMPRLEDLALGPTCCTDLSPLSRLKSLHTLSVELCDERSMTRHSSKLCRRLRMNMDAIVSCVSTHLKTLTNLDLTGVTELYKGNNPSASIDLRPLSHLPFLRCLLLTDVPTRLSHLPSHTSLRHLTSVTHYRTSATGASDGDDSDEENPHDTRKMKSNDAGNANTDVVGISSPPVFTSTREHECPARSVRPLLHMCDESKLRLLYPQLQSLVIESPAS